VVRLAKAATGKDKIVKFEGHFHGWSDVLYASVKPTAHYGRTVHPRAIPMTPGQAESTLADLIIAPWNDLSGLEVLLKRHHHEIAAIILEPYPTNNGCMESDSGYLPRLRKLASNYDVLLIFDEVVSGFRMAVGGAQQHYEVTPDLCSFGKAMAGGMPIAGFAGKASIMSLLEHNQVSHLGTYNSNAISCSAAAAVIRHLKHNQGECLAEIQKKGLQLIEGLGSIFAASTLPLSVSGHGSVLSIFASDTPPNCYRDTLRSDSELLEKLHRSLLDEGVWIFGRGNLMLSSEHTQDQLIQTLEIFEKTVGKLEREYNG
jgi:glutamate-1-semialdehyde 2,1-aminomutase